MHIFTISAWSDKFKDLFFKSTNRLQISNVIIELIPLNKSEWKRNTIAHVVGRYVKEL